MKKEYKGPARGDRMSGDLPEIELAELAKHKSVSGDKKVRGLAVGTPPHSCGVGAPDRVPRFPNVGLPVACAHPPSR